MPHEAESPYFWAKTTEDGMPGCSVREHCLAAAEVAKLLLKRIPEKTRAKLSLPDGVPTLVALHDIGKISPGFQTKCAQWRGPYGDTGEQTLYEWRKSETNHAASSQWILEQYFKRTQSKLRPWKPWAQCLGAHHGRFSYPDRDCLPPDWVSFTEAFLHDMVEAIGPLPGLTPAGIWGKDSFAPFIQWIIGLTEVADWIASNEDYFPAAGGDIPYPLAAERALEQIGFSQGAPVVPGRTWAELFPHAPTPRDVQRHLWEQAAAPGIYVIEDSMGGGKTEAALGLTYHLMEKGEADGLYFALPTQTTSNRIFLRVLDFLERAGAEVSETSVRLAHGNSWLVQEDLFLGWQSISKGASESGRTIRNWFASSRRALLSRFGVGTIDQALMGEINVKHSFVRRFALAGKVVILDEVHSYDLYTGTLLTNLVHNLRKLGSTVIILSATLTRARLAELLGRDGDFSGYPLVTKSTEQASISEHSFPTANPKEVHILQETLTTEEAAERAYERAEQGQCVLWIRNTVKDAQDAYKTVCATAREGGPEIGLLHARFPLWRRQELENQWIGRLGRDGGKRPAGCVLITTQVAEQSLDIDADFLITDLAPTDMLLQRAGRLWRHERPLAVRHASQAEMLILIPPGQERSAEGLKRELGASGYVYAPYVLMRTVEAWAGKRSLDLPADIRPLLEATYTERQETGGSAMDKLQRELEKKKDGLAQAAIMSMEKEKLPTQPDNDDASTRYGACKTAELLLLRRIPEVLSTTRTRYEPLYGGVFTLDTDHWSFPAAKAIQENIVRVPATMLPKDLQAGKIEGYNLTYVIPVFPLDGDGSNCYTGTNGESLIGWNPILGAFALPKPEPRNPLLTNDDDDEQFMY